jgi:hypothetical protein
MARDEIMENLLKEFMMNSTTDELKRGEYLKMMREQRAKQKIESSDVQAAFDRENQK